MIHRLFHLLRLNFTVYENWWIEIQNGKKLMCGERCAHCGELMDIRPTGLELRYEKL